MEKNLFEIINTSKSKNDVLLKYFGYNNKRVYNELNDFINKNNIDVSHLRKKIKCCPNCNTIVVKKGNIFCNSSCSASFNNKRRTLTDITKNKISESQQKRGYKKREYICIVCGEKFTPIRRSKGKLSSSKCCSDVCRKNIKIQNSKKGSTKSILNGTHKGWSTRNILSYPERFFIKVLNNNNIKFETNFPVNKKKDLGLDEPYSYFLDFYIENKKIDLEIDGKQHDYRKVHDDKRDNNLINNGFNVYRIKWKSINSVKGKEYIKHEIDKFLEFYNKCACIAPRYERGEA